MVRLLIPFRFFVTVSTFFILGKPVFAQTGYTEEPEFKVTAAPDKWKGESAVILAQKIDYAYVRKSLANGMNIREYVRKRILLQDKNAIEKFAEFYYATYGKKTDVGYLVIKPGGKVTTIDLSKAVEVNKDVPGIYRPIYLSSNTSFFKMAIPDLEPGDIIDFHYESASEVALEKGYGEFTPFVFTLSYNYPVYYQKFQFDLDKGTNAMFKSYNGAPKLHEGDGGFETKASDKKSLVSYFIIDKNREKEGDERWSYSYRNSPTIKLKITYQGGGLGNTLFGKKGEASAESVSLDKLRSMYSGIQYYSNPVIESITRDVLDYLKNNGKDNLPNNQMVREIYYVFRKIFLQSYYTGEVKAQVPGMFGSRRTYTKKESKKDMADKQDEVTINKLIWAAVISKVCVKKNLGVELLLVMPRYMGKWNDMLFEEELEFAMRVKGDKYYFLFPFDNFDTFAQADANLDGAEAYAFALGPEAEGYYKANVPSSSLQDNLEKNESQITIPESMDLLKIERLSTYSGLEKPGMETIANFDRAYLTKDFQKYIINPKKDKADLVYDDPDKEERKKNQLDYLKKEIEGEGVEVDKYENFELINDGRSEADPALKYKENYSLKKMVNKAGRNYLIDFGKLIGGQIKLEEKELKTRENDIWVSHARTIENSMVLNIPKGFTVDGYQDLNINVDNESGAFISVAKLDGGRLTVTTKKIYKKNFDKKEAWPNYVSFLEGAYKFSQAKLVMKKQ